MLPEPSSRATRSSSAHGEAMRRAIMREKLQSMKNAMNAAIAACDVGGLWIAKPNDRSKNAPSATVMRIALARVKKMRRWRRHRRIHPRRMPSSHLCQG